MNDPSLDSLLVKQLTRDTVPDLLEDAQEHFGVKSIRIYVDDRELEVELKPALQAAGCQHSCDMVYLSHTGEPPTFEPVPDLNVEPVTRDTVRDYEIVRAKAFVDSEEQPEESEVAANADAFLADLSGSCQLWIGRIRNEAAAIAGWYEGSDRLVFHLATRVPFRNRGIARHLLSYLVHETYGQNRRSIMIFTDPEDSPIQFYRRLGFTQEVYWQARYLYEPATQES